MNVVNEGRRGEGGRSAWIGSLEHACICLELLVFHCNA